MVGCLESEGISTHLYVVGGFDGTNRLNKMQEYCIETDQWRERAQMDGPLWGALFCFGDLLQVVVLLYTRQLGLGGHWVDTLALPSFQDHMCTTSHSTPGMMSVQDIRSV